MGRRIPSIAIACALLCTPKGAAALEPLTRYLEAGRSHAAEARETAATVTARRAETRAERAGLFPALEASAGYTRNQYDIVARIPNAAGGFDEATFTPRNQLDASVTLSVPLLDLGAIRRTQAARASEQAAVRDRTVALVDLDDRIVAAYTNLIAYEALSRSAAGGLDAARANLEVVRARESGGLASDLDVRRATAQVAAAEQTIAEAALRKRSAARELEAITGVAVVDPIPAPPADLRAEAALPTWLDGLEGTDEVASARTKIRAAEANLRARRSVFLPLLSARATERLTNAAGFGEPAQWAVGVTLTARFDVQAIHRTRVERANVMASEARYDLAKRSKRLEIEDAHDRVESLRVRAVAAASEAEASQAALAVAQARYEGGTATQLEVVQALRDGFVAEASRIQATSELSYARAQLRLAAGRAVEDLR